MSPSASACREIEPELVSAAMEEAEPPVVRRVHAHLDRCGACRREFERYRVIDGEAVAMRSRLPAADRVAASRAGLETRLADLKRRLLRYRVFTSPFGPILIARSEEGVALLEYLEHGQTLQDSRLFRIAGVEAMEDGAEVEALYRDVLDYLGGRCTRLPWSLDLRLARSDFHRRVLDATAAIPYGAVISYAALAREIGQPRAVRAAAQALRWNPLPIVIPCHRVIGASGDLTGYAGGETDRKQTLLSVEGVPMTRGAHDFRIRRDRMYVRAPGDPEYCLPTCASAVPMTHAGSMLFGSRDRAEAAGLLPCTTCRPDLHPLPR